MNTRTFLRSLLLLLAAFVLAPLAGRAADLSAVKARLADRQATVDALKDRKIAGENNRGFLEVRGPASPAEEKIIADENVDRRTVYSALAAETGVDSNTVGRQRAQQISIRSKRGVWIQDTNGEWRQK
jgi:uncharacterized protein YdbL (DUF1318 family)